MTTFILGRETTGATAAPEPTWRDLYRAGGLSAFLTSLSYVLALVIVFTLPPAPTTGGAATLEYIAAHRSSYIVQQILWSIPSVLLIIVFLALYPALMNVNKSYAAISVVLSITAWAVTLAYPATGGGAPALVVLSDQYAALTSEAQRSALAAVADGLIALNTVPTLMGVLEATGILLVSLLMLRSIFSRVVVYLGIATGAIGIVCEALKPLLGPGYIVYGLLLFVWLPILGWQLYRLGRVKEATYRGPDGEPGP